MANTAYSAGIDAFARGEIVWTATGGSDIRAVLVDGDYTPNFSADEALDDVPAQSRVATSGAITLVDASGGQLKAQDVTLVEVTGNQVAAVVVYKHTGTESTSTLIAYLDTGTGLPVTPNGGDITIEWGDGSGVVLTLTAA